MLPELAEIILEYCLNNVDAFGYLNCISKSWVIKPTEATYCKLCQHIYLAHYVNKILNIDKWGSWRNMLINRPRIRTNGLYWLRTSYWKPPNNEKFWEKRVSEYHEMKFFRYMRFFPDGHMLYALNNSYPTEVIPLFDSALPIPKKLFCGEYKIRRNHVYVEIPTHYSVIRFVLQIESLSAELEGGNDEAYAGNFNVLKILEHKTASFEQLEGHGLGLDGEADPPGTWVSLQLPDYCNMKFYRQWQWC